MSLRRGFTLFELLVSLAILSVVSTLAVSAFLSANAYWNDLRAADQLEQHATAALDSLRDDFGRVLSSRVPGASLRGTAGTATDERRAWKATFEDDRVEMTVDQANAATRQRETVSVSYSIDRKNGPPRLVRAVRGGVETVIAPDIAGLRLSWFDGTQWLEAWDRPGLPRAVRVSLSLADPVRPERNLARTSVFNVNVP